MSDEPEPPEFRDWGEVMVTLDNGRTVPQAIVQCTTCQALIPADFGSEALHVEYHGFRIVG